MRRLAGHGRRCAGSSSTPRARRGSADPCRWAGGSAGPTVEPAASIRSSTPAHETVDVVDPQRRRRVADDAEWIDAPDRFPKAQAGTASRGRAHRDAAVGQRQASRSSHLPGPIRPRAFDARRRWTTPWPHATARTPLRSRGHRPVRNYGSARRRTIGPTSPTAVESERDGDGPAGVSHRRRIPPWRPAGVASVTRNVLRTSIRCRM